jgi:cation:H+ antiporter
MDRRNIVSAIWDIIILGAMLLGLLFPVTVSVGALHVGLGSLLVIALGVMAFWAVHESERLHPLEVEESKLMEELKPKGNGALMKFGIAAAGVVVCGFALAVTGDKLATQTGLSHTFVGTLFLAIATSLPEFIVSITAMRIGAYELMLGNILGSNIWNVMIVAFSDIAYARAPLSVPRNLGWGQVYSGLLGILATCVVILALVHRRPQEKRMPVARESLIIAALYFVCLLGLFFGWSIL